MSVEKRPSIIRAENVRMAAPVLIRVDYNRVVPRVISSATARQELRYSSSRSAIIKAGTFRMDNTPRVIKADIRPVVKPVIDINANKDNRKAVYISGTTSPKVVRPALTIPPRQLAEQLLPRFTRMSLEPIKQSELKHEQVKQTPVVAKEVVVAPLAKVEPVKVESPHYLAVATEAYKKAEMPKPQDVIDAVARTTMVEEVSVRKFTFNPHGWAGIARNFIKSIGFGTDQALQSLYPADVFVVKRERVRFLPG